MDSLFRRFAAIPVQAPLLILGVLGYMAILVTGFGGSLGLAQPLILYSYLCVVLLLLQATIIENHSTRHVFSSFFGSIFFLVYAAAVVIYGKEQNVTRQPLFYIIINVVLLIVFLYDVITRRSKFPQQPIAGNQDPFVNYLSGLAADIFSFAALASFLVFALDILASPALLSFVGVLSPLPSASGQAPCGGYVCVDLRHPNPFGFGINLGSLSLLNTLDLVLGLIGAVFFLLLFGLIGVLVIGNPKLRDVAFALPPDAPRNSIVRFLLILRGLLFGGLSEALYSLRSTFGALIWLVPAFIIAFFAQNFTGYLNNAARCFDQACASNLSLSALALRLLFPPSGITSYVDTIGFLALGTVAVLGVLAAVAVNEHSTKVVRRTLSILNVAGQTVAVTLTFFFFSLMALNATIYITGLTQVLPFQIGPSGLLALALAVAFSGVAAVRHRMLKRVERVPVTPS